MTWMTQKWTIHAMRKNNLANKLVHMMDGEEAVDFLSGTENLPEEMSILSPG
jgi:hypothetical protein